MWVTTELGQLYFVLDGSLGPQRELRRRLSSVVFKTKLLAV